ncbi:MAG TPA: hypothetical protein VFE17_12065 [Candidatus Baltobacteraceae bacterium]|jgi:energy-converting hydrogenase Eha subunit C|nr:hypothetical protein [Candidatus Baltobacteraceae bacterium]
MGDTTQGQQLRPLGIGEIFDRSVTIYVRHFLLFVIISAFFVLPLSVVNYFVAAQQSGALAQILDQIEHGPRGAAPAGMPLAPWIFAVVLVAFFLAPFMYVAMAAAIGKIYTGQPADWRAAYAVSLRHAGGIIVTAIFQLLIVMAASVAGVLVLTLAFALAFLLVRVAPALGVIAGIAGAVLGVLFIVALMLCYLATALAFNTIGIEEASFGRAIAAGFARVFNRAEIGKAVLICLAFLAVQLGLVLVSAVVSALIAGLLHQTLLQTVFAALFSLVTTGFIGVLLAVYYFDVRIRREGLDMQAAIDRMQPQP